MDNDPKVPLAPFHDAIPPLPLTDGALLIDTSTLEKYTTCRRSMQYYGIQKREPSGEKVPLTFGKGVHLGLESHYRGHNFEETIQVMRKFYDNPLHTPPEGDHRTLAYSEHLLEKYQLHYYNEPFEILKDDEGEPYVERSFAVFLGNVEYGNPETELFESIPVFYTGRIDLIVVWDGKICPLDHKTTSMMGARFFDEFYNGQQPIGYAWAVQKTFGVEVDGFVVNALACRKPTKTGKGIEFDRMKFAIDPERIVEWEINTLTIIQDMVEDHSRGYFPMETKWCVGKYGKCPYFEVCTLPHSSRHKMLGSGLYRDVTWSPLEDATPLPRTPIGIEDPNNVFEKQAAEKADELEGTDAK
jgi:hypothetical protein